MTDALARALNHFMLTHVLRWQQLETLNVEYVAGTITEDRFAKRVSEIIAEHEKAATKQKEAMEAQAATK